MKSIKRGRWYEKTLKNRISNLNLYLVNNGAISPSEIYNLKEVEMINVEWIVVIIAVAVACLFFGILIGMAIFADKPIKVLVKIEKDEFDDFDIKSEGTHNGDE